MEAKDVWRDDAYNYTGQTLDYAVKMNGVVVKKGHATAKDFPITIYLNRLAVDYLEVDWHNNVGFVRAIYSGSTAIPVFQEMPDAAAQFTLVRIEGDTEAETLYDVVYVDTSRGELKTYLSEPINGHACTQQVLPYTVYGGWSGDTPEPPGPEPPGPDSGYTGQYFTLVPRSDGRIRFEFRSNVMDSAFVEADSYYSTDSGATWHKTYLGEILQLYAGEKVMFKGENDYLFFHTMVEIQPNPPYDDPEIECGFITNCDYDIEGNIMSLFYGDDFSGKTAFPSVEFAEDTDVLYGMFDPEGYTYLNRGGQVVNAHNLVLPVLDLHMETSYGSITGGIYGGMFANCTKLETAPALPATALEYHCYEYMFAGCTSLTTAPELPATVLKESCYEHMFGGCTRLTKAPELPATTLAEGCYHYMFAGCTHLVEAPELPAMEMAEYCYDGMFQECTSLVEAPALSATTLANGCYQNMFLSCTSLTEAPALPATLMFIGCYGSMFAYCTSLTKAPELPATTLANKCYQNMFANCTSLTKAPDLPATTLVATSLVSGCYQSMFSGCRNLSSIKCLAEEIPNDTTTNWLKNVSDTGVFIKAAGVTWPTGESGIPSGWRILNA